MLHNLILTSDLKNDLRRRLVFDELVGRAADRAAKEAKRAARAAEAFTALLRETKAIAPGMPWEEAHVLIAGDRDYQAVCSQHYTDAPTSCQWPPARCYQTACRLLYM